MARGGRYKRVGMSRPLSEMSGIKGKPDIKADITGVRLDGKIDLIEIRSPSQTVKELREKLARAMQMQPPEMQGEIFIINP